MNHFLVLNLFLEFFLLLKFWASGFCLRTLYNPRLTLYIPCVSAHRGQLVTWATRLQIHTLTQQIPITTYMRTRTHIDINMQIFRDTKIQSNTVYSLRIRHVHYYYVTKFVCIYMGIIWQKDIDVSLENIWNLNNSHQHSCLIDFFLF